MFCNCQIRSVYLTQTSKNLLFWKKLSLHMIWHWAWYVLGPDTNTMKTPSQGCQTYGPRAACGPRTDLMRPARKFFFMLCMRKKMFPHCGNIFFEWHFFLEKKHFLTDPARLRKICLHVAPELKWVWHPCSKPFLCCFCLNSLWCSSFAKKSKDGVASSSEGVIFRGHWHFAF